ncbi:MAG: Ty1/Copia family ribonuclease HI [Nitrososphaeraceae archaeon]
MVELKLIPSNQPSKLFIDNTSSIDITNKDMANTKTKHIAIQYYFIKEAIDNQEILVNWISTKDQLADIFTKPLGPQAFTKLKIMLMGEC